MTFGSTAFHSAWAAIQLTLDLDRLVGVPAVIDEKDRAEEAERYDTELERIALPLAFLSDFFVKEI